MKPVIDVRQKRRVEGRDTEAAEDALIKIELPKF
jgi:hypothetical protein